MNYLDIVHSIKKSKNLSLKNYFLSSFLISNRISTYFSGAYVIKGIVPNKITLHMIYSGIIGGILFSLPNIYLKILGAVFIHIWFILDCSDGEVARYSKCFSKYGKELDYVAHLIDHPLFGISFLFSLMQLKRYNILNLVVLIFLSNLIDYLFRNITALNDIKKVKNNNSMLDVSSSIEFNSFKGWLTFFSNIFIVYPNFVLFGVIAYFIDYKMNLNILFYYLIVNVILSGVFYIRQLWKITLYFSRNI